MVCSQRLVVQLDHFRAIGGSALTDTNIAVPENELGDGGRMASAIPVTYVPFRNAHFLSVAVSWAEAIGAGAIYIGAVAEDSSGLSGLPAGILPSVSGVDSRGDAAGDAKLKS